MHLEAGGDALVTSGLAEIGHRGGHLEWMPKFSIARTCRHAAVASILPGRDASACQRDESDACTKLEQDWTQYSAAQRPRCTGFPALDRAPSYVELLTCLEMAKQAKELSVESTIGAVTNRR